jgi:hypothetical protein
MAEERLKLWFDAPSDHGGFTAPLTVGRLSMTALAGLGSLLGLLVFYVSSFI